jgi:hypothetical protein
MSSSDDGFLTPPKLLAVANAWIEICNRIAAYTPGDPHILDPQRQPFLLTRLWSVEQAINPLHNPFGQRSTVMRCPDAFHVSQDYMEALAAHDALLSHCRWEKLASAGSIMRLDKGSKLHSDGWPVGIARNPELAVFVGPKKLRIPARLIYNLGIAATMLRNSVLPFVTFSPAQDSQDANGSRTPPAEEPQRPKWDERARTVTVCGASVDLSRRIAPSQYAVLEWLESAGWPLEGVLVPENFLGCVKSAVDALNTRLVATRLRLRRASNNCRIRWTMQDN